MNLIAIKSLYTVLDVGRIHSLYLVSDNQFCFKFYIWHEFLL